VVGSEGTLGIIVSARLRLSMAPQLRVFRGFEFPDVTTGAEAIRRVMQLGLRPAVVRLYDEVDTFINTFSILKSDSDERTDGDRFAPRPADGAGALPSLPGPSAPQERQQSFLRSLGSARHIGRGLKREAVGALLSHPKLVNRVAGSIAERVARRGCRFIVGLEGSSIRREIEARLTMNELVRAGGKDLGEDPGREWFEHRYSVSYGMSGVFRAGAFVDTMEVASTWDRLLDLYHQVKAAISEHALVMAHFSHAYEDGCSIYFTFAAQADTRRDSERLYDAIWRDGLAAVARAGGTISHHHGIGLLKGPHMAAEHREAMSIFRAVKNSLDPDAIMNPGKLGLEVGT
jgi:alkyldihydroxyacetonephosphate synthase